MSDLDLLGAYAVVGVIWLVGCLAFSHIVSEDKNASRMLIRGFWFTPIWPLVVAYGIGYGFRLLWFKAEWGK